MENEILKEEQAAEEIIEAAEVEAVAEAPAEAEAAEIAPKEEKAELPAFDVASKPKKSFDKKTIITVAAVVLAAILALNMFLPSDTRAFNSAKESFAAIDEAYNKTNEYSHDIYEAWFKGINKTDAIKGKVSSYTYNYLDGLEELVDDMNITFEEIKMGVAYFWYEDEYESHLSDTEIEKAYQYILSSYDSVFSACIDIVTKTYEVTGRETEIEELLERAKGSMKSMSDKYSDYVHYPDLKDYLTLTRAFFNFCSDPEGSFNQVVETFNSYRNESRSYYFALDYIFEE